MPALTQHDPANHPSSNHPSQSHKCKAHNVAYIESGTVDGKTASTLVRDTTAGHWSGTLVVDVKGTNH